MNIRILIVFLILIFYGNVQSQNERKIDNDEVKVMVRQIADSLEYYYVSLEMGQRIGDHLIKAEEDGVFHNIEELDSLAKIMTREMRSINGDLHLSVLHTNHEKRQSKQSSLLEHRIKYSKSNFGIVEAKILAENVGYLKINHFSNWSFIEETEKAMASAMSFLQNSDAIIFDVRNNRGGVPNLVAFLCSYLFDGERIHLAQYHHRYRNSGYGLYTYWNVPGKRLPDVPVHIIVNEKSASAAEEFAYFLKHNDRAIIIGDTTAGAGYGAMSHKLNDQFSVLISSEEDINPATNSNFEQVGVIPHFYADDSEAFDLAYKMAIAAAKEFSIKKEELQQKMLNSLENISNIKEVNEVIQLIKACHNESLLGRYRINSIAYSQLDKSPELAVELFRLNVDWYPLSSNVYDSLGDGLKALGKYKEALDNYLKALRLGRKQKSGNVDYYAKNVEEMKKILKTEKTFRK